MVNNKSKLDGNCKLRCMFAEIMMDGTLTPVRICLVKLIQVKQETILNPSQGMSKTNSYDYGTIS